MSELDTFIDQLKHPIASIHERREIGKKTADLRKTLGGFAKTLDLFYKKRKSLKEGQGLSWKQGFSFTYYFPDQSTWLTTGYGLNLTMPLIDGQPVLVETKHGPMMTDSISVRSNSSSPDRLVNVSSVEATLSARNLADLDPALAGLAYVNVTSKEITIAPSARITILPDVSLEIQVQQYDGSSDDHKSPYGRLQQVTFFPRENVPKVHSSYSMFSLDAKNSKKNINDKIIQVSGGDKTGAPLVITVKDLQKEAFQEIKIPWVDPKPILTAVEQRLTQLKTQLE